MDLIAEREAVRQAAHTVNAVLVCMEDDPPRATGKVAASLDLVDRATLYVGIIGLRPSSVADGYDKSMVELEYERAVERGIDRRIFIRAYPEDAAAKLDPQVEAFQARLYAKVTPRSFESLDDLRERARDAIDDHRRMLLGLPSHTIGSARERAELEASRSARITRSSLDVLSGELSGGLGPDRAMRAIWDAHWRA